MSFCLMLATVFDEAFELISPQLTVLECALPFPQSRSLFLKSFLGLTSRVSIKCSPDWLLQMHSSIPHLSDVRVFVLAGSDGSSAGGQPAGRQHHAEDGSTLLLCTLAPLQRQVRYLHRFQSQHTFLHPAVLCRAVPCAFTHVSLRFSPVCSASSTRQKESCALWPGSRCLKQTGETGERVGGKGSGTS